MSDYAPGALMRTKLILVILLGLFLAGCATYQPSNIFAGGYSEIQLAPDVFSISYEGTSWSGAGGAHDFAILRAADVTVKNGFRYFGVFTKRNRAFPGKRLKLRHPRSQLVIKCFTTKPDNIPVLDARFLQRAIRKAYKLPPLRE